MKTVLFGPVEVNEKKVGVQFNRSPHGTEKNDHINTHTHSATLLNRKQHDPLTFAYTKAVAFVNEMM